MQAVGLQRLAADLKRLAVVEAFNSKAVLDIVRQFAGAQLNEIQQPEY